MIQDAIRDICAELVPGLTWTVDFATAPDNSGAVYATGGAARLSRNDMGYRYPTYQVYIRSSDWDYAKAAAEIIFEALHKKRRFYVDTAYEKDGQALFVKRFFVFVMAAASDPIRVGEQDGVMEYSINFEVTMKDATEEAQTKGV